MRSDRYVQQASNGRWEVVKEGHRRATAEGATKRDAVNTARKLVREEGGGEVLVLNRTGKIVEAATVRPQRKRAAA
ncbi:MAG TPA: DUF2188 domain-containing protein [Solirubrobacterales bacterium]|nr:DUF2188 domain-containing protein [Solirubrobacterales bacterium]